MAFHEKANWVILLVSIPVLVVYLVIILPQALTEPIGDVPFAQPMVGAIVAFIALCIAGMILAAATNPAEAEKQDERDTQIDQLGERVGNSLIAVGSVVALILALIEADHFWIANSIFFAGLAAAVASAVAKIAAYHGPFQQW